MIAPSDRGRTGNKRRPEVQPHRVLAILIALLISLQSVPIVGTGSILTRFDNGYESVLLDMPATVANNTTGFLVPLMSYALNATMNVSSSPLNGSYPLSPAVDIGDDGTIEWRYNGVGYGRFGLQDELTDGNSSRYVDMATAGSNHNVSFILPTGAKVTSAEMNITGMPYMYSSPLVNDILFSRSANAAVYNEGADVAFVSRGRAGGLAAIGLTSDSIIEWDLRSTPGMPHLAAMHPYYEPSISRLIVPTYGGGVWVLNPATNASFTYGPTTSPAMALNVTSAVYDAATSLLLVGTDKGLYIINMSTNTSVGVFTTTSAAPIPANDVRAVAFDRSRMWAFAATGSGIGVVDLTGTPYSFSYSTATTPAIVGNNVMDILYVTEKDSLYVGCYGSGATILNLATNTSTDYTTSGAVSLYDNRVRSVWYNSTDDTLLLGGDACLDVIVVGASTINTYNIWSTPALPQNQVNDVVYDGNKNIAILSHPDKGLAIINLSSNGKKTFPVLSAKGPALSDYAISGLVLDLDKKRIITSGANPGSSVEIVNTSKMAVERSYSTSTTPRYYGSYVNVMALDRVRNAIFMGSPDGGVTYIDLDDNTTRRYTTTIAPVLPSNNVRDLHLDGAADALFIATDAGACILNLTAQTIVKYDAATSPSLPSNDVSAVSYSTEANWLLVSTFNAGLAVVNLSSNTTTVYSTTSSPALNWNNVSTSVFDAARGLIVVATRGNGIDIVNLSSSIVTNPGKTTLLDPTILDMAYDHFAGRAYLANVKGLTVVDALSSTVLQKFDLSSFPMLALNDTVAVIDRDPSGTEHALAIFRKTGVPWGVLEMLKWAEPPGGLNITVGNATVPDANLTELMAGKMHVDLTGGVSRHMSDASPNMTDAYGNRLTIVVLNITFLTGGKLLISDIKVTYEVSMRLPDFADRIRAIVNSSTPADTDAMGRVRIPINVTCGGPGTIVLKDMQLLLDDPPMVRTGPLTGLGVPEDGVVENLIDLYTVFDDEHTDDANLTFGLQVIDAPNITVVLNGTHEISVDAASGGGNDDWTGTITLNVSATDTHNLTSWTGPFTVSIVPVNDPPWFTSSAPTTKAKVGVLFLFNLTGDDKDGDTLSYSLAKGPNGMSVVSTGPKTANLTWLPIKGQEGVANISISLSDGAAEVLQNFTLNVDPANVGPNHAPKITSTPPPNAYVGGLYRYQLIATDDDGDAVTFTLDMGPTGMQMGATSLITWTPTSTQMGAHDVRVRVTDGKDTALQTFTVTVQEINYEPTVTALPVDLVIYVGESWSYQISAEDKNGDTLTYTLLATPLTSALSVDEKGLMSWTPTENEVGIYLIEITVSDGTFAVTVTTFIEVISMTTPFYRLEISIPKDGTLVKGTMPVQGRVLSNMKDVTKVELLIQAKDSTSEGLWKTVTGTSTWSYSWDTTTGKNGIYLLTARAYNASGIVDDMSINVTVENEKAGGKGPVTLMGLDQMVFIALMAVIIIIIVLGIIAFAIVRRRGKEVVQETDDDYEPMMVDSKKSGKIEVERLMQQQVAAKAEGEVEKELLEKTRKEILVKKGGPVAKPEETESKEEDVGIDEVKEVERLMEEIQEDLTGTAKPTPGLTQTVETPADVKPETKAKAWEIGAESPKTKIQPKLDADKDDVDRLLDEIEKG